MFKWTKKFSKMDPEEAFALINKLLFDAEFEVTKSAYKVRPYWSAMRTKDIDIDRLIRYYGPKKLDRNAFAWMYNNYLWIDARAAYMVCMSSKIKEVKDVLRYKNVIKGSIRMGERGHNWATQLEKSLCSNFIKYIAENTSVVSLSKHASDMALEIIRLSNLQYPRFR